MIGRLLAVMLVPATFAGAAMAQPADADGYAPRYYAEQPGPGWYGDGATGPEFYPQGYDPQYGSGGRVADAAEFAADYGCRPIWNGKVGHRTRACN